MTDRRIYRRQKWAFDRIRAGLGCARYGSDEWLAYDDSDPRKVAAVVKAAELYARQADDLVEDLRTEVEESRRAHKAAEDAAYVARRDAHRKEWKHLSVVRSFPWNERENSESDSGGAA